MNLKPAALLLVATFLATPSAVLADDDLGPIARAPRQAAAGLEPTAADGGWQSVLKLRPGTRVEVLVGHGPGAVGSVAQPADSDGIAVQRSRGRVDYFPRTTITSVGLVVQRKRLASSLLAATAGAVIGAKVIPPVMDPTCSSAGGRCVAGYAAVGFAAAGAILGLAVPDHTVDVIYRRPHAGAN